MLFLEQSDISFLKKVLVRTHEFWNLRKHRWMILERQKVENRKT